MRTTPNREAEGGGGGAQKSSIWAGFAPKSNPLPFFLYTIFHGSYNLEKVLNFTSRLEKLLEFDLGPCKIVGFFTRS